MRKVKVWTLGDAVVDLLPESSGKLLLCPGGAPANVAVGVARLGEPSGFIGRVAAIAQAQYCGALATTAKGAMTALPHRHNLLNCI